MKNELSNLVEKDVWDRETKVRNACPLVDVMILVLKIIVAN